MATASPDAQARRERSWAGEALRERSFTGDGSVASVSDCDDGSTAGGVPLGTSPLGQLSSHGSGHGYAQSPDRSTASSSASRRRLRQVVNWIQQQHVPPLVLKRLRRLRGTNIDNNEIDDKKNLVPWIAGLDRVVFGTQPAAEVVVLMGLPRPPRYLWYMLSGACCDGIQLGLDLVLHKVMGIANASTCWALGFCASIVFRHSFHRYLVFGDYVGGYWYSLLRLYGGYSVSIVLSTAFNRIVTAPNVQWPWHGPLLSHYTAWVCTLLWTGIANYFILKKLWSFGGGSTKPQREKESNST